jgi:hypothetical protein
MQLPQVGFPSINNFFANNPLALEALVVFGGILFFMVLYIWTRNAQDPAARISNVQIPEIEDDLSDGEGVEE